MPDRPPLSVPYPFEGASTWLQNAYRSLAPQVTDLQASDNPRAELKVRRQLAGYLHRFRQEAGKLRKEWEHTAERERRKRGISSPEFAEASRMARTFVELMRTVHPESNRDAIKQLEAFE